MHTESSHFTLRRIELVKCRLLNRYATSKNMIAFTATARSTSRLLPGVLVHRLLRSDRLKQLFDWFHVIVFSETHFEKVRRARCHPKSSQESNFPRPGTNTFGLSSLSPTSLSYRNNDVPYGSVPPAATLH